MTQGGHHDSSPPPVYLALALIAALGTTPAHADCAADTAYPPDCQGPSATGDNCTVAGAVVTCDFPLHAAASGSPTSGIDVHAVTYWDGATYRLDVFGVDGDGEQFCCETTPTVGGTFPNWELEIIGTQFDDDVVFDYNSETYYAYDMTRMVAKADLDMDDGVDVIQLPSNNQSHVCTVHGGPGNDIIGGSPLDDTLFGDGDQDEIYGNGGDDEIHGGGQDDTLDGGDDDDLIFGDGGVDTIDGGDGADRIDGGTGADLIDGEGGQDQICAGDLSSSDVIHGGPGADDLWGGNSTALSGQAELYGDAPNSGDRCDGTTAYIDSTCEVTSGGAAFAFCL